MYKELDFLYITIIVIPNTVIYISIKYMWYLSGLTVNRYVNGKTYLIYRMVLFMTVKEYRIKL